MKIFYAAADRNTVSSSDPLRKNENTVLLRTLDNTPHAPKKRSPTKKQLSTNRVKWNITSQHTTSTRLHKKYFINNEVLLQHVPINLLIIVFNIFISHFYISYSKVNDVSYCKDIANCIYKKRFLNCSLKMAL
jgi:hypothetical protein